MQRQSRAERARGGGSRRPSAGWAPQARAGVPPAARRQPARPPAEPGGHGPDARPVLARERDYHVAGGRGRAPEPAPPPPRHSRPSPALPPACPPRSPPPTCQGKERSVRAARKRRSKLGSRLSASALSSGAMAGRGGAAALPGRRGGRGAGLRR